jgi:hypothetical protein
MVLVNGINDVKDGARKEASELKNMMRQFMNNNINNSSLTPQTQHTVITQVIFTDEQEHSRMWSIMGSHQRQQERQQKNGNTMQNSIF